MTASTAGFGIPAMFSQLPTVLQPVDEEHARAMPDLEAMLLKLQSYGHHQDLDCSFSSIASRSGIALACSSSTVAQAVVE